MPTAKAVGADALTVLTKATPGYAGGEKELIARGGVDKKSLQVRVNERFADQIHKNKETDS